jgi:hypothetical protein
MPVAQPQLRRGHRHFGTKSRESRENRKPRVINLSTECNSDDLDLVHVYGRPITVIKCLF